jgi:hypothetical protein
MPRKSFRPEEIIAKLREADVLLGQGKKVAEVGGQGARDQRGHLLPRIPQIDWRSATPCANFGG